MAKMGFFRSKSTEDHEDIPEMKDDLELSNAHLKDSVSFNLRHASQHIDKAVGKESTLSDRGISLGKKSVRGFLQRHMSKLGGG